MRQRYTSIKETHLEGGGGGAQEARAPLLDKPSLFFFYFRPQTALPFDLVPPSQTGAPIQTGAPYPKILDPPLDDYHMDQLYRKTTKHQKYPENLTSEKNKTIRINIIILITDHHMATLILLQNRALKMCLKCSW